MTKTLCPSKLVDAESVNSFLASYDTFLFDCDGVLWLGSHLLPNIVETLEYLESLGKELIFVTNNSTKSRKQYVSKFAGFGINVKEDQIFTSGYASSLYVRDFLKLSPETDKIWIFGESGIKDELDSMGFECLGADDIRLNEPFEADTSPFLKGGLDDNVKCVVAGLDTKLNYHKLAISLQYLLKPNIHFVATNIDSTFPQKGMILPGAGSAINSLAYASNRTPVTCGKPNLTMLETIVKAKNLDRAKCCMVGDRLNTDIRFGEDGKLGGTLLVLTGIETEENALQNNKDHPSPKFYADKLGDLFFFTHQAP